MSPAEADLVRRDRELPDLALLLDADHLTLRLARQLPGRSVSGVRVTYLRYKPGHSCLAACRAEVGGQPIDFIAKTYAQSAAGKLEKAIARPSVAGPLGAGRFVLGDSAVLVSVFPNDGQLERLIGLLTPDSLRELIARLGRQPRMRARLETLRHNPERRFVGRVICDDTSIATVRCYRSHDYAGIVAKAGALRSRGPLKLPRRLTQVHRYRLLAFEWLPGDLLEGAIGARSVPTHTMELVGSAIAHLHAQDVPTLPRRTDASEGAAAIALARHLACVHPPVAGLAQGLAERLAVRLAEETARPRPLHGDFYAKQVLLDGPNVALIDLDEAALGDPAIDLGRFHADLEATAAAGRLEASEISALVDALLRGYRQTSSLPARLDLHIAAQLLRLAPQPFRRREPSWPEVTAAILERADAFLDSDARDRSPRVSRSAPDQRQTVSPHASRSVGAAANGSAESAPCVVDPFGITNDPQMPCLTVALSPDQMAERFSRRLLGLRSASRVDVLRISVVRYKPGLRCLVAYDLAVRNGAGTVQALAVMGKVRVQSADTSTHDLVETLWSGSFGPSADDGIVVPEPLGWIADVHMIVQRRIAGVSLGGLLEGPTGLALARRAAAAIHKLHAASAPARRRHTVDDEIRILRQRLTGVAQEQPRHRARLERLLEACEQLAARVRHGVVCGIHRDFYPDQLLVDGDRLYLTDLDLYSEGPPALDVGNFAAHIDEYSLRRFSDPSHLADRRDMLIERYLQLSASTTREDIDIWTTLSLARHVAISTQFAERQPFTAALLDLCERRVFDERTAMLAAAPSKGASR